MARRAYLAALVAYPLWALALFWQPALTNRVLAEGDAFTYFTPYRDYANAMLRQGHIPLWNPYLFLGVPFLANTQAAVLYPLHWLFIWLSAPKALAWSMVLHIWLAAMLTYAYARQVLQVRPLAAFVAGLVFSGSGYLNAHATQINQLNGIAWLPGLLWMYEEAVHAWDGKRRTQWGRDTIVLGVIVALQLLAGHTQTAYISLIGLGLYALAHPVACMISAWKSPKGKRSQMHNEGASRACPQMIRRFRSWRDLARLWIPPALTLSLAVFLGLALAAAQILPTLELSRLSARAGGLSYREAISFSLRPRLLAFTLLPPIGAQPDVAFASPAYGEYLAYVGVLGMLLAVVGMWQGRPRRAALTLGGLALAGFVLALGGWNPAYFLAYKLVPGWNLFRAPARWMALYSLGMAGLTGLGTEALIQGLHWTGAVTLVRRMRQRPTVALGAGLGASVGLLALGLWLCWPGLHTWMAWGIALTAGLVLTTWHVKHVRSALLALVFAVAVELWLAAQPLPQFHATAPEAVTSLRTAPAHLLSDSGRVRFLSMSGITFDPGDLPELQQLFADQLDKRALYDFIVATKQKEILAPNLPLLWRVPAVDGYDGGLLPLRRYVELETLFVPKERLVLDGRLREQLRRVPPVRLLNLLNVKYVITDKVFDVWVDNVYYDLQFVSLLGPGAMPELTLSDIPPFSATALGLVSRLQGMAHVPDGTNVAELIVCDREGFCVRWTLKAGQDTAEGRYATAGQMAHQQARVIHRDASGAIANYLTRIPFPTPLQPARITVRPLLERGQVVLRGLSLIDERTGTFVALVSSTQGRFARVHSGDVKVYANLELLPRAYVVHQVERVADDKVAMTRLATPDFDPAQTVLLMDAPVGEVVGSRMPLAEGRAREWVRIVSYLPEEVEIVASLTQPGYLVLSDTDYPGWRATVDGQPARIYRANLLFRAVALSPGVHQVIFRFVPTSWRWGWCISVIALAVAAVVSVRLSLCFPVCRKSPDRGEGG